MLNRVLSIVAVTVACVAAGAAEPTAVDPNVTAVLTGGAWEFDGVRGQYRIIVRNHGHEHVVSTIDVEWIEERNSEPRVHAQVEVKELADRVWSIGAPRFIVRKGECRLRFVATNSYTFEERVFEAILGANGKYTTVRWEKKAA